METTILLNNGARMPVIGLGCYKASPKQSYRAVRAAVDAGYRHIDTASFYGNEAEVGRAVKESGVPREELFVVTKLWPTDFSRPRQALEDSLRRLNVGYLDAYLLHWPGTDPSLRYAAYECVLEGVTRGEVRSAGVSNFLPHHLDDLTAKFGAPPAMDQVELHPWYPQEEVRAWCSGRGVAVVAWGPILRGRLSEAPLLGRIGEKFGKTPAQIALRWHLQKGHAAIPKSVHEDRIRENFNVFDFSLAAEEMAAIDCLACGKHTGKDPDTFNG